MTLKRPRGPQLVKAVFLVQGCILLSRWSLQPPVADAASSLPGASNIPPPPLQPQHLKSTTTATTTTTERSAATNPVVTVPSAGGDNSRSASGAKENGDVKKEGDEKQSPGCTDREHINHQLPPPPHPPIRLVDDVELGLLNNNNTTQLGSIKVTTTSPDNTHILDDEKTSRDDQGIIMKAPNILGRAAVLQDQRDSKVSSSTIGGVPPVSKGIIPPVAPIHPNNQADITPPYPPPPLKYSLQHVASKSDDKGGDRKPAVGVNTHNNQNQQRQASAMQEPMVTATVTIGTRQRNNKADDASTLHKTFAAAAVDSRKDSNIPPPQSRLEEDKRKPDPPMMGWIPAQGQEKGAQQNIIQQAARSGSDGLHKIPTKTTKTASNEYGTVREHQPSHPHAARPHPPPQQRQQQRFPPPDKDQERQYLPTERYRQEGKQQQQSQPPHEPSQSEFGAEGTWHGIPSDHHQPYNNYHHLHPSTGVHVPPTHQQQQQQQQPRPSGPHGHQIPPGYSVDYRRRPPPLGQQQQKQAQQQPPVWRRLWKKIEGGLDSLADMEDVVAGRANKLYSATVETASTAIKAVPQLSTLRVSKNNDDDDDGDEELLGANFEIPTLKIPVRKQQKPGKTRNAGTTDPPPQSLTARHESMRQQQLQEQKQQQQQQEQAQLSPPTDWKPVSMDDAQSEKKKQINWNDVVSGKSTRPILATGGASALPGDGGHTAGQSLDPLPLAQGNYRPEQRFAAQPIVTDPSTSTNTNIRDDHRRKVQAILQNPGSSTPPQFSNVGSNVRMQQQQQQVSEPQSKPDSRRLSFDDNDSVGWKERLSSFIPRIPTINFLRFRRRSYDDYAATMDAWSAEDGEEEHGMRRFFGFGKHTTNNKGLIPVKGMQATKNDQNSRLTPTVAALMDRCENGASSTLLKEFELKKCVLLGRKRALLDLVGVFLFLYAAREVLQIDPIATVHSAATLADGAASIGGKLVAGWFLHAAVGTVLAILTNIVLLEKASSTLASSIGDQALKEAQYGSLFLRLVLSSSNPKNVVEEVQTTSHSQALAVIESTRLNFFVACLLATFVMMKFSFLQMLVLSIADTLFGIVSLSEWRSWPVQWKLLWSNVRDLMVQFLFAAKSVVAKEVASLSQEPARFVFDASLVAMLLLVMQIPRFEISRKAEGQYSDDPEREEASSHTQDMETLKVWNLGASSATRLQLVSKRFALDEILERWRTSMQATQFRPVPAPISSFLRFVLYGSMGGLLLCVPILAFASAGLWSDLSQDSILVLRVSLRELAVVLVYTQFLFLSAIGRAVEASFSKSRIARFLSDFSSAAKERTRQMAAPAANLQLQASISPTAGVMVRDLWTAHSIRRAWAVQGANLMCRGGEVVVVLGDDGSGKSRLLTALSEAIVSPAKEAQTVVRVRGTVHMGGLDVSKWDPNQLRKRVGLMLNDVRTVSDLAQAFSGLTLEEILEPHDAWHSLNASHAAGPKARACMLLALKMTGLYSTLLPRLPSKLSTVVTANEEDLNASFLFPHYVILSPVEWSKLLLARLLCQSIFDNESAAATTDKVANSLLGSLLLLDDATVHFSETDEGPILRNLRSSMAATVLSSTRWATGRWADRVVVLKDGVIVETGSHNELLSRGPQQSIYAAKWREMT